MDESLKHKAALQSPLSLAYIGDSVFDLRVKEYYVKKVNKQVEKYHNGVSRIVRAISQAEFVDLHEEDSFFTEEELQILHRGRNASVHTKAKNATMAQYKKATGLEAVIGYLYLSEQYDRINEIMQEIFRYFEEKSENTK